MNTQQIQNVTTDVDTILLQDIRGIIGLTYKDKGDLGSIQIGQFTAKQLLGVIDRCLKQLKKELEENGYYLPHQYNYQNEYGAGDLHNDLIQINAHIKGSNFVGMIPFLNKIIYYQVVHGFWDKGKRKSFAVEEVKLGELKSELETISSHLLKYEEQTADAITRLVQKEKEITSFISTKNNELQQIANNLQAANSNSTQINNLLNTSTAANEKIKGYSAQIEGVIKTLETKTAEESTQFSTIRNEQDKRMGKLDGLLGESDLHLKTIKEHIAFVDGKKAFFDERIAYLENLIGREVGASLFETFKQRKKELDEPLRFWKWGVAITTFITITYVFAVFTNLFGLLGEIVPQFDWIHVSVNTIKTLPIFFLFYYVIHQYNKERNFQEEYAFKSAVALTIKAYSEILKDKNNQDQLILESVLRIYQTPFPIKKKGEKELNSVLDMLNVALDKAGTIVGKIGGNTKGGGQ